MRSANSAVSTAVSVVLRTTATTGSEALLRSKLVRAVRTVSIAMGLRNMKGTKCTVVLRQACL